MRLAIVVQRYGAEISGGAELHARYIAERLSRVAEVDVLTTCATDYITWRNALPAGEERVNGVAVHRFPVDRERDPWDFGRRSARVFDQTHSIADELAWLESEGPTSRALIDAIRASSHDYCLFFSYRYYHAYHGVRAVPGRAILVPTAERDPAAGLAIFRPIFQGVRAIMYNSMEERALIQHLAENASVPGVVVGVGSAIPDDTDPARFRKRFGVRGRFAIYIGRIDENKGCKELFEHFARFSARDRSGLALVLVGSPILPIPPHPRIHHLGYLSDQDKFDALAAADLLIMPSRFESLSMVAIEAWALGKPVLANGRCDVLKGQCLRSNAGLYYDDAEEFVEALRTLAFDRQIGDALGRNGRKYFRRHYDWPVIERKYTEMFERLGRDDRNGVAPGTLPPLPGWFGRRRRNLPPARSLVDAAPAGPVRPPRPERRRAEATRRSARRERAGSSR